MYLFYEIAKGEFCYASGANGKSQIIMQATNLLMCYRQLKTVKVRMTVVSSHVEADLTVENCTIAYKACNTSTSVVPNLVETCRSQHFSHY